MRTHWGTIFVKNMRCNFGVQMTTCRWNIEEILEKWSWLLLRARTPTWRKSCKLWARSGVPETTVDEARLSWNSMGSTVTLTLTPTPTSSPTSARGSSRRSRPSAARAEVGVTGDFPIQLATNRTRTTILADLSADLSDTRAFTRENDR